MNFSFDWFLTVPGILITCGVLVLIIALIVFIVSSVKGKKEKAVLAVSGDVNANSAVASNPAAVNPTDSMAMQNPTAVATPSPVATNGAAVPEMNSVAAQNSSISNIPTPDVNSGMNGTQNINPAQPTMVEPSVAANVNPTPVVEPVAPATPMPTVEATTPVTPVVEPTPVISESPVSPTPVSVDASPVVESLFHLPCGASAVLCCGGGDAPVLGSDADRADKALALPGGQAGERGLVPAQHPPVSGVHLVGHGGGQCADHASGGPVF